MNLNLFDDPRSAGVTGSDAVLSESGRYRYALTRTWAPAAGAVCFVMLNPSTADASEDDPTIRRCIGFARAWGFGRLEVVNLFAWRATDPAALRGVADPVGPENDGHIMRAARGAKLVIAAWGAHGALLERGEEVRAMLARRFVVHHLGLTKEGHPRHPLYLRADLQPEAWR